MRVVLFGLRHGLVALDRSSSIGDCSSTIERYRPTKMDHRRKPQILVVVGTLVFVFGVGVELVVRIVVFVASIGVGIAGGTNEPRPLERHRPC